MLDELVCERGSEIGDARDAAKAGDRGRRPFFALDEDGSALRSSEGESREVGDVVAGVHEMAGVETLGDATQRGSLASATDADLDDLSARNDVEVVLFRPCRHRGRGAGDFLLLSSCTSEHSG